MLTDDFLKSEEVELTQPEFTTDEPIEEVAEVYETTFAK